MSLLYQDQLDSIKESLENEIDEEVIIECIADEYLANHCSKIKVQYDCGDDRSYWNYEYAESSIAQAYEAAAWGVEKVKKELLTINHITYVVEKIEARMS